MIIWKFVPSYWTTIICPARISPLASAVPPLLFIVFTQSQFTFIVDPPVFVFHALKVKHCPVTYQEMAGERAIT